MNQGYFKNLIKNFFTKKQESACSNLIINDDTNSNDSCDTPDILDQYENMLREVNGLLPKLDGYFNNSSKKNKVKKTINTKELSKPKNKHKLTKNKLTNPISNPNNTTKCSNTIECSFPFIKIVSIEEGIIKDILLTTEEVRILRTACRDNYGIINLLSKTDSIKSLFNKGIIGIVDTENARMGIKEELIHIFNSNSNDGTYSIEDVVFEWGGIGF